MPDDELRVALFLRKIVWDCIPTAAEHLAYNVPYYKINKNICFIWPASIIWGQKTTYEGVRFGFTYGNLLRDEIGYLYKNGRKQVYWRDFTTTDEIDVDLLKTYIFEAVEVDRQNKEK